MYKSRSASMQRSAGKRDRTVNAADAYSKETPPILTKNERLHFGLGDEDKNSFLEQVRPLVRSYAKNGFRKPLDVSRLMNKAHVTTACGSKWTRRLVWFLLYFLFEETKQVKSKISSETRRPTSNKPRQTMSMPNNTRPPLTAEEVAKRLAALGRIVRRD
jgi:hypothetical protein